MPKLQGVKRARVLTAEESVHIKPSQDKYIIHFPFISISFKYPRCHYVIAILTPTWRSKVEVARSRAVT